MNEFEKKKKELLTPIYLEAGAALMDCQGFEYGIALLIFHLARVGIHDIKPESIIETLEDRDKKTAGQLINLLKRKVKLSDEIEESIKQALSARNRLIHRVLIDNVEKIVEENSRLELVKEIRALRSIVQSADKKIRPIINAFSEVLDGYEQDALEKEVKAIFK